MHAIDALRLPNNGLAGELRLALNLRQRQESRVDCGYGVGSPVLIDRRAAMACRLRNFNVEAAKLDLIKAFSGIRQAIGRSSPESEAEIFDQYDSGRPDHQNAIDMLPGWNCSFPSELKLKAGPLGLFHDQRIRWALETFGSIEDKSVLEIGPLEGMHTHMLNQHRPRKIDAVEANRLCFMRCLISAQILNIDRATFYLGDAGLWLDETRETYDLIVASGVLYHMDDPVHFLKRVSKRCNALFLWTHFFLDEAMEPSDPRRWPFSGKVVEQELDGTRIRCYERSYKNAAKESTFCGGMRDRHFWLHRDDILAALKTLGFADIQIMGEDLKHPGGPCFSLLARRVSSSEDRRDVVQP